MKNVILFSPNNSNGGIASWSRKYVANYKNDEFNIVHVGTSGRRNAIGTNNIFKRLFEGLLDTKDCIKRLKNAIIEYKPVIMHATTSGSFGTLRDYLAVLLCHKYGVKAIMHCRYGCITESYNQKSLLGLFLRHVMSLYDMVWVLDSRSYNTLKEHNSLSNKVYLTANCIAVPETCDLSPKQYNKVAFIANLFPSKGLFELLDAVVECDNDIKINVISPGTDDIINTIHKKYSNYLNEKSFCWGKSQMTMLLNLMKECDILALPTYYEGEAFPISPRWLL